MCLPDLVILGGELVVSLKVSGAEEVGVESGQVDVGTDNGAGNNADEDVV